MVICKSPLACIVPVLVNGPLFCITRSPLLALTIPALRTPRPTSVPNKNILPAYIPPNCATSKDISGVALFPTMGTTESLVFADKDEASIALVPVTTLSSLAQIPALT